MNEIARASAVSYVFTYLVLCVVPCTNMYRHAFLIHLYGPSVRRRTPSTYGHMYGVTLIAPHAFTVHTCMYITLNACHTRATNERVCAARYTHSGTDACVRRVCTDPPYNDARPPQHITCTCLRVAQSMQCGHAPLCVTDAHPWAHPLLVHTHTPQSTLCAYVQAIMLVHIVHASSVQWCGVGHATWA